MLKKKNEKYTFGQKYFFQANGNAEIGWVAWTTPITQKSCTNMN